MIFIINICKERLHYYEFVKPIEDIIKSDFKTIDYKKLTKKDLDKADRIIICGTSLKDFNYLELKNLKKFEWIKDFKKPILGICGGMQIIALIYGSDLKNKKEIGFYKENFVKDFLGLKGGVGVYHLHNKYVDLPKYFEEFINHEIPKAIKHKTLPIYGVLFHPEVMNKEVIKRFVDL